MIPCVELHERSVGHDSMHGIVWNHTDYVSMHGIAWKPYEFGSG